MNRIPETEARMFDTTDELLRKIRLGEDSVLELKAVRFRGKKIAGPERGDLADELAAMANTGDGVCVLGVDDKTRRIEGIPLEQLDLVESYVRQICNDSIVPPLAMKTVRMELPDEAGELRPVLKIDVPRSLFVHKSPGGYFHRQGSSKRELSPDLLARLFQQRSQARIIRFEEQPVPETSFRDLTPELWERFLPQSPEDPQSILRKMKLLTEDDLGEERASVAGILLCSRRPDTWLPGAYVEAVRYRGTLQDSNHQVDAERLRGPLDRQIRDGIVFILRNMFIAAVKRPGREEFPQYSDRAVFEAVVNAVVHRDYSVHGSKVRILQFDDRVEIYSPGPLPNSVTVDSLPLRQATRNELITTLLARIPVEGVEGAGRHQYFMERRGDGVPIILNESLRLSGRRPEYRLLDDAELLLTIYSADLPNQFPRIIELDERP
ncbi:MAG TPA: ATP-binding protein [Thermoanaerobaculia bacterium]|nr:ATP-binding protein [Thermoanaerobaculia bacterium]